MRLSPDQMILWQYGFLKLNGTIAFTWGLMAVAGARIDACHAQTLHGSGTLPLAEPAGNHRYRNREAIADVGLRDRKSNRLSGHAFLVHRPCQPLYRHPRLRAADRFTLDHRGTRAECADCGAVLRDRGAGAGRLSQILREPTIIMLPFNIISELSRTLAWQSFVRQHDERDEILAILLTIYALHLPIAMSALGLLTVWCRPTSSAYWQRFI